MKRPPVSRWPSFCVLISFVKNPAQRTGHWESPPEGAVPATPKEGSQMLFPWLLSFNTWSAVVLLPFSHVSLGTGHSVVSFLRPFLQYPHNIPAPKDGSPNIAFFVIPWNGSIPVSRCDLLNAPSNLISTLSVAPLWSDEHDPFGYSFRLLHNGFARWISVNKFWLLELGRHPKHDTGTLAPKQCDTDSAIWHVLISENGSWLSSLFSWLREQPLNMVCHEPFWQSQRTLTPSRGRGFSLRTKCLYQ